MGRSPRPPPPAPPPPRPARLGGPDRLHDRARRTLRGPARSSRRCSAPAGAAPAATAAAVAAGAVPAPGAATSAPPSSSCSTSRPQNGYQLIQEIERRTEGVWKPSPGSVYPALQQLEDEGLVHAIEVEGKRAYELTPDGREYVDSNREELGNPFEAATGGMDEGVMDLRGLMFQVGAAAMQVAAAGHTDEARKILADTRRALYRVLAEDDPGDTA